MDAKSCAVFIRAAETGSITRAARELGYTQAGVSMLVKKLEDECGFALLFRDKNGVRATCCGERMLPVMREIVRWNERFRQTAAEINGVCLGTLRVGCYSSVAYHWMPRIIRRFRSDYPKIEIEILEGNIDEIEGWIYDGRVDIGFVSERRGQKFRSVRIARDPFLAVLPPDHPMCGADSFPLAAFGQSPLIVTVDVDSYPITEAYEKRYGPLPDMKLSSTDPYTIIAMVAGGLGVSTLPSLLLRGHSEKVVIKEISPPFFRTLIMGMRANEPLPPAAARFLEYVRPRLKTAGKLTGIS